MASRIINSIRNRILLGGMATILLIGILWLLIGSYYLNRYEQYFKVVRTVKDIHISTLEMHCAQKDFLLTDLDNSTYFQTGRSDALAAHSRDYKILRQRLQQLEALMQGSDLRSGEQISVELEKYDRSFNDMIAAIRRRGFYNYGLESQWRQVALAIERNIMRTGNLRLRSEFLELRRAEKDYLLRGGTRYITKVEQRLDNLHSLLAGLPSAAVITNDLKNYENYFREYREINERIGTASGKGVRGVMTAALDKIEKILSGVEAHALQNSQRASRELQLANTVILLLGIIVGACIFSLFAKSLSDPIIALKDAAVQIGDGRLDTRVDVRSNDEVGVLGKTFNEMAHNLQDISEELRSAANTLASSAGQILASTTQVAATASQTAAAVSQTTATVEEVKQTAQLSNQKARDVADSAQHSAEVSFVGNQSVGEAIAGMERVREQMNSIAESVINLSDQSQAIGDIINTVNDLAEQSNLLAVNAAIEAAKAGEQGKGFAVVAQEVKSLAEQSKQATARVRSILNEIQKATSAAVMSTEQGTKAVEAGLKQAEEAGHSIEGLAQSIEQAAQAALQISASSQEQLIGVDQVALAMNNIKDASSQNVASMRQLEVAARDLSNVGQNLRHLVDRFRSETA